MPAPKSDWSEYYTPRRCDCCGEMHMSQAMQDYYNMVGQMYGQYQESMSQMYPGAMGMPQSKMHHPHHGHHHHKHEEQCDCCGRDDCHCRCCINDADLVVYSRVGERRVVPITIDNCRRRERTITLELSKWSRSGGRASEVSVQSALSPQEFTLKACEEQVVTLVVETKFEQGGDEAGADAAASRLGFDVDDCLVLYADLRVEGCDIRPVRIALTLLPRDCDAYQISCCCSCC